MEQLKNIIVTGSNKGIGFGIAAHIASQQGWNLILACRNVELGQKALQELKEKNPNASIHL
jgi:NAD(P)-dependent dehydrogenase (short-subunit alcohol dehydrogenase family)